MKFVVEVDVVLDALLVERLQDHVPGAVGGVTGPAHGRLAELARMPTEGPLRDLSIRRAAEGQAPVLELVDGLHRLAAQDLHGVLVGEIVAALHRVKHVPFPVVLFHVAERGADASLGRAGV